MNRKFFKISNLYLNKYSAALPIGIFFNVGFSYSLRLIGWNLKDFQNYFLLMHLFTGLTDHLSFSELEKFSNLFEYYKDLRKNIVTFHDPEETYTSVCPMGKSSVDSLFGPVPKNLKFRVSGI